MYRRLLQFLTIAIMVVLLNCCFSSQAKAEERLYYIHSDHLGSTTVVTDESGNVVSQQTYYPYGETRSATSNLPTERQYTSQVSDVDQTGLYYYNARYYNPQIAKFTQADEIEGPNRYAYVGNNPLKHVDPSGNSNDAVGGGGGSESNSSSGLYLPVIIKKDPLGYNSDYFMDILYSYEKQNPDFAEILRGVGSGAGDFAKVGVLGQFVGSSGYFPYSSLIPAIGQKRQDTNPKSIIHKIYNGIYNLVLDTKFDLSPVEQYQLDLFVCYNKADLLSTYVQAKVPGVPIYAAGVPGHAFDIFEYEEQFYLIDPTGPIGGGNILTLEEAIKGYPDFDWTKLGYNPEMSSPEVSDARFYGNLLRILVDLGLLADVRG